MERMKLREMCQHAHLTDGISSIQNLRRRAAWQMIPEAHAWTRQLPERLNPSHKSKRPAAGGRSRTWRLIMLRPYLSCTSTTSTTSHDLPRPPTTSTSPWDTICATERVEEKGCGWSGEQDCLHQFLGPRFLYLFGQVKRLLPPSTTVGSIHPGTSRLSLKHMFR